MNSVWNSPHVAKFNPVKVVFVYTSDPMNSLVYIYTVYTHRFCSVYTQNNTNLIVSVIYIHKTISKLIVSVIYILYTRRFCSVYINLVVSVIYTVYISIICRTPENCPIFFVKSFVYVRNNVYIYSIKVKL